MLSHGFCYRAACGEVRCHLDPSEALITLDESSTYIEREKRQRRAEVEKCQHELEGKLISLQVEMSRLN